MYCFTISAPKLHENEAILAQIHQCLMHTENTRVCMLLAPMGCSRVTPSPNKVGCIEHGIKYVQKISIISKQSIPTKEKYHAIFGTRGRPRKTPFENVFFSILLQDWEGERRLPPSFLCGTIDDVKRRPAIVLHQRITQFQITANFHSKPDTKETSPKLFLRVYSILCLIFFFCVLLPCLVSIFDHNPRNCTGAADTITTVTVGDTCKCF